MDTIAMYFLKLGEHYLEEDHFKAYGFLEEAANMGNCKAAMLLGKYYEKIGQYEKAFRYLRIAAEGYGEEQAEALYLVGTYYEYGWGGVKKDCQKAYRFYEMAEKKGDKRAKKKMSSKGVKNLRDAIREILHM